MKENLQNDRNCFIVAISMAVAVVVVYKNDFTCRNIILIIVLEGNVLKGTGSL